jgi:NAD(P)-dependent dehydrogenase (short-subunit alcohol dehydrogenase family)
MEAYRNKVAVITGAGSGIGRELARQLAGHGARLALSDVSPAGLAETMALCPAQAEVRTYALDVSKRAAVFAHADEVHRDFGTAHYLFNNAGVSIAATFEHITIEELEWLLGINLWGVIYGSKAFLPKMLAQREGHIVNISSVFGMVTVPAQSAYHISKFGVRGLTECLWRELEGTGVRATSVHPGGIRTNIERAAPVGKFAGDFERRISANVAKTLRTPPEVCAREILAGVARGRKRILTGKSSTLVNIVSRLMPTSYGLVLKQVGL